MERIIEKGIVNVVEKLLREYKEELKNKQDLLFKITNIENLSNGNNVYLEAEVDKNVLNSEISRLKKMISDLELMSKNLK